MKMPSYDSPFGVATHVLESIGAAIGRRAAIGLLFRRESIDVGPYDDYPIRIAMRFDMYGLWGTGFTFESAYSGMRPFDGILFQCQDSWYIVPEKEAQAIIFRAYQHLAAMAPQSRWVKIFPRFEPGTLLYYLLEKVDYLVDNEPDLEGFNALIDPRITVNRLFADRLYVSLACADGRVLKIVVPVSRVDLLEDVDAFTPVAEEFGLADAYGEVYYKDNYYCG